LKTRTPLQRENDRIKNDRFKGYIPKLFDIATKALMTEIQQKEDFFQQHRILKDIRRGWILVCQEQRISPEIDKPGEVM
jgi:hypothetical protein